MNLHQNSVHSSKSRYQSIYLKKIQTQTTLSNDFRDQFGQVTDILEAQMKKIHRSMYKKHQRFNRTMKKKIDIQNQEDQQRSKLKIKIENKMRKSQKNLLSYRQKSISSLSNRLSAQYKKIQEIKKLERTIYDQKFEKYRQMTSATQNFFKQIQQKKKRQLPQLSIDTSYLLTHRKKSSLLQPRSNIKSTNKQLGSRQKLSKKQFSKQKVFTILRTPRQSISQKQKKKMQQQNLKERSFLRQYVQKMQSIQETRKKAFIQPKIPTPTIAKHINHSFQQQKSTIHKNKSIIQQVVNNKRSFSDLYKRKLEEKKSKKVFFLSQSLAQGDNIMKDNSRDMNKFKLAKLIRDSQNQLTRKGNFTYMQKFLKNSHL